MTLEHGGKDKTLTCVLVRVDYTYCIFVFHFTLIVKQAILFMY